ncbi:hypothetical protein HMPREF0645_2690 [Hallella bergensis DSM 17361]|uniref:Uncharacterized protein n=1 Tax=Hallella bergensis DSM 17361 TaxID=585502 RepID=D1Q0F5_9BACT|nr:hypothetical protein [Hallella bergensis]EFA42940.1 hypothetical protein HMPREF0645_2690 [Hallella bergensis DSM 17361]
MTKKKRNPQEPVREINAVAREVKREKREVKQKIQGDSVVKWIFGALLVLAILYMVWTMTIVG